MKKKYVLPQHVTSFDIKRARKLLGMTQKDFAAFAGVSTPTVERWETSEGNITGPICALIFMIETMPIEKTDFEVPEKKLPVRLWYMCGSVRCTLIDVDETRGIVRIKNYTRDISKRAFGANTDPSIEDYNELLKSRCFPETRNGMKLILDDLGLPFYDPFLIIKKTEGRMSEDSFWIDIEGR